MPAFAIRQGFVPVDEEKMRQETPDDVRLGVPVAYRAPDGVVWDVYDDHRLTVDRLERAAAAARGAERQPSGTAPEDKSPHRHATDTQDGDPDMRGYTSLPTDWTPVGDQ